MRCSRRLPAQTRLSFADSALVYVELGRRDLKTTASMRGRCFIGTYAHEQTTLVGIGRHGTANITANMFDD
jgi:hypothetical protein